MITSKHMVSKINSDLNIFSKWLKCNKLKLNIDKTKYLLAVISDKNIVSEGGITIDGENIGRVKKFTYCR